MRGSEVEVGVAVEVSDRSSADTTRGGFAVLAVLAVGLGLWVWVPQCLAGPRCRVVVAEGATESPAPGGPAAVVSAAALLAQNAVVLGVLG